MKLQKNSNDTRYSNTINTKDLWQKSSENIKTKKWKYKEIEMKIQKDKNENTKKYK